MKGLISQVGATVGRGVTQKQALPVLASLIAFVAIVLGATPAQAHDVATPASPAAHLAAEGLLRDEALCGSGYRIEGTDLCTHGSDAAPPDFAGNRPLPPGDEPDWPQAVICDGDGVSGKRVQLLYVRQETVPDRYDQSVNSIRTWAREMDEIFEASARQTGGHRRIRFVTDPTCQLVVLNVVLPALENDTFNGMIAALVKLGYNSPDRKYVAFVDASVYCGIGTIARDSTPLPENRSNHRAGYARIDRDCWGSEVAAHELVHTLGGVQMDAPHASGGWHCVDEFDLMCYSDTPLFPAIQHVCPGSHELLLDCNHDDYYHTNPPADSYLATHWNVANSAFLMIRDEVHNLPPTVQLVTLAESAAATAPATLTFTAEAADPDGIVTRVEFYNGTTWLGTATASPYSFTWQAVGSGTYTVTATVYDDLEASATSNPLTLVVAPPANTPPVISLAPLADTIKLTAPATMAITAQVADSDGSVTQVEFYHGATLLATVTTSPYTFTWTEVTSGAYTLTATVYDDRGASTTSSPLLIEVAQPTVQPTDLQNDHHQNDTDQHDHEQSVTSQVYLPLVVQ